jgi:hypothetical protein
MMDQELKILKTLMQLLKNTHAFNKEFSPD